MLNPTQLAALRSAEEQAIVCEKATGCPRALTVAQWALESGWGHYGPQNNVFGIKAYPGCHGVQTLATHEYVKGKPEEENLEFATFASLEACFEKHALLVTSGSRYLPAFAHYKLTHDTEQLVRDIAPIYAPGNPKYVESVFSILHMTTVSAWLKAA